MAEIQLLRVFVASPSDVQAERDALAEAVRNVNAMLSATEAVQLRLVRWEEDVEPAVGADPQAIVNEQVADGFEVFVGILWKHFGTPTPRSASGTVEEFERAVTLHRESPEAVSVLFYFKTAPVPVDVDTSQLAHVQEFRRQFSDTGLYGTFTDSRDFAGKIQIRLMQIALKWVREGRAPAAAPVVEASPADDESEADSGEESEPEGTESEAWDDEDAGFLDLVEEGTAGFESVTQISRRMTRQIETLGTNMEASTADLKEARDPSGNLEVSKAKKAINSAAASMNRFADDLEKEISPFREAYGRAIRAYGKAATMLGDFQGDAADQLSVAHDVTAELEKSIGGSQSKLREFREIVGNQPRLTSRFNRARRRVLEVLDKLDEEMTSARTSAQETMDLFEELMRRFENDGAG